MARRRAPPGWCAALRDLCELAGPALFAPGRPRRTMGACKLKEEKKKAEGDKKDAKEKKKVKNESKTKGATMYGHVASQTPKLVRSLNHVLKLHFPNLAWNRVRVVLEPRQGASGMASVVGNFTTTGVISSKLPRESTSGDSRQGRCEAVTHTGSPYYFCLSEVWASCGSTRRPRTPRSRMLSMPLLGRPCTCVTHHVPNVTNISIVHATSYSPIR